MKSIRAMPLLDVPDVSATSAFFQSLGFATHGGWGDPPSFEIVQRGDVTLGLAKAYGPVQPNAVWDAYIYVSDVGVMHAVCEAAGATVSEVHRDNAYGVDDFTLTTPDGHRIAFGEDRNPDPGPGLGNERGNG